MYIHQIKIDGGAGVYAGRYRFIPKASLAYAHTTQLPQGTRVLVDVAGDEYSGEVVGYGTDFTGFIKSITKILPTPEVTHVLVEKDGTVWLLSHPVVAGRPAVNVNSVAALAREQGRPILAPYERLHADFVLVASRECLTASVQPHRVPERGAWQRNGSFKLDGATLTPIGSR